MKRVWHGVTFQQAKFDRSVAGSPIALPRPSRQKSLAEMRLAEMSHCNAGEVKAILDFDTSGTTCEIKTRAFLRCIDVNDGHSMPS
jgi:hypothetical protein